MNPAQKNVRRDRAGLKHFQEMRGMGFQNRHVADEVKRLVHHGALDSGCSVGPVLVLVISSIGACQVRLAIPGRWRSGTSGRYAD